LGTLIVTESQAPSTVCAEAQEGKIFDITCPDDLVITNADFASYGLPQGKCGAYSFSGCNAPSSQNAVVSACLFQHSCSFEVGNAVFTNDPCGGTIKELFVQVQCSTVPSPLPTPLPSSIPSPFPTKESGKYEVHSGYRIVYPDEPISCSHLQVLAVGQCIPNTASVAGSTYIYYVATPTAKALGYFKITEYSDGVCGTAVRTAKERVLMSACGRTYSPELPVLPHPTVAYM